MELPENLCNVGHSTWADSRPIAALYLFLSASAISQMELSYQAKKDWEQDDIIKTHLIC